MRDKDWGKVNAPVTVTEMTLCNIKSGSSFGLVRDENEPFWSYYYFQLFSAP